VIRKRPVLTGVGRMDAGSEWADDIVVSETIEVGREPGKRLRRTAEEKRRIVEASGFHVGTSVWELWERYDFALKRTSVPASISDKSIESAIRLERRALLRVPLMSRTSQ
jgi:hypothetical protein